MAGRNLPEPRKNIDTKSVCKNINTGQKLQPHNPCEKVEVVIHQGNKQIVKSIPKAYDFFL